MQDQDQTVIVLHTMCMLVNNMQAIKQQVATHNSVKFGSFCVAYTVHTVLSSCFLCMLFYLHAAVDCLNTNVLVQTVTFYTQEVVEIELLHTLIVLSHIQNTYTALYEVTNTILAHTFTFSCSSIRGLLLDKRRIVH